MATDLLITFLIGLLGGITPLAGAYFLRKNWIRAQLSESAKLYMDVSARWGTVLPKIYQLRNGPPDVDELKTAHKNIFDFMAGSRWTDELRPICNFYSDLGFLVDNGNVDLEKIVTLVTISEEDFNRLKPLISWINAEYEARGYRNNLYQNWVKLIEQNRKLLEK
ncbi:MAG: hypothetical protein AAF526_02945 [Pseudomonadota bacterium]